MKTLSTIILCIAVFVGYTYAQNENLSNKSALNNDDISKLKDEVINVAMACSQKMIQNKLSKKYILY